MCVCVCVCVCVCASLNEMNIKLDLSSYFFPHFFLIELFSNSVFSLLFYEKQHNPINKKKYE